MTHTAKCISSLKLFGPKKKRLVALFIRNPCSFVQGMAELTDTEKVLISVVT